MNILVISEKSKLRSYKREQFKKYLKQPVPAPFAFNTCSEREIVDIVNSLENSISPGIVERQYKLIV